MHLKLKWIRLQLMLHEEMPHQYRSVMSCSSGVCETEVHQQLASCSTDLDLTSG